MVVAAGDMETVIEDTKMRLWVGFLSDELFNAVDMSLMEFDSDVFFEVNGTAGFLPFGQSLVDVANEHYAFFSAGEEGGPAGSSPGRGDAGSDEMSSRLERIELMMADLQENLTHHMERKGFLEADGNTSPSTLRQPKAKSLPPSRPTRDGALRKPSVAAGTLDQSLVAAATQAGVGTDTLDEVARLMSKNVKAQKVKDMSPGLQPDPLSDADEIEEQELDMPGDFGLAQGAGDPMERAVISLAEIVKTMNDDKKKKQMSKIESMLEGSGASSSETVIVGSGKRSAAARRALRQMLSNHPEELYNLLERLMMEDLMSQTLAPGMPTHALSSRAWVEHRSRIGAYKASAHCAWGVAGALDCLARGQVQAARARLNILLLQIDQAACDRGNWTLASELSLEHPPPFSSLLQHSPPGEGEPPYSRLLDPRWGEVAMAYLREQDDFLSKQKNLGKKIKKDDVEEEKDSPRSKFKPTAKAKASPEGDV